MTELRLITNSGVIQHLSVKFQRYWWPGNFVCVDCSDATINDDGKKLNKNRMIQEDLSVSHLTIRFELNRLVAKSLNRPKNVNLLSAGHVFCVSLHRWPHRFEKPFCSRPYAVDANILLLSTPLSGHNIYCRDASVCRRRNGMPSPMHRGPSHSLQFSSSECLAVVGAQFVIAHEAITCL